MNEEARDLGVSCPNCNKLVNDSDVFCGNCGREIKVHPREVALNAKVFTLLQPTLLYYFITLFLLAIYKLTDFFPDGLEGLLIVSGIDILVVIIFWVNDYSNVRPLFKLRGLSLRVLMLTVLGAIGGSLIVSFIAELINASIQDDVFYNTNYFLETSYPLFFATLLVAVQPAIFEEIAFRGFLFNNLKEVAGGQSAIYVSALIFGIMHLAFISLVWLVPIGLAFAYLRSRYNTLWYGVVGHFTYNFVITLYEFWGWF